MSSEHIVEKEQESRNVQTSSESNEYQGAESVISREEDSKEEPKTTALDEENDVKGPEIEEEETSVSTRNYDDDLAVVGKKSSTDLSLAIKIAARLNLEQHNADEEEEWEGEMEVPCVEELSQSFFPDYEEELPQADDDGHITLKHRAFLERKKKLEQRLSNATACRPCGDKGDILISMQADDLITGFPPTDGRRHVGAVCTGLRGVTRIRPRLALVPDHRILMRVDHRCLTQVKLISGGRLGQEPLFTEYVGRGMLTAAVLGQTDGTPPAANISAAIRELYTPKGILILLRSTPENRLVFGYAMERARVQGMDKIDMILVGDGCWDRRKGSGGRRGRAGLVLMIKMAGAMAEAGESLKDIYDAVRTATVTGLATISAATSPRLLIGGPPMYYVGEEEGEGFNGSLRELVQEMMKFPLDPSKYFSLRTYPSTSYIILVNTFKTDHWLMYTVVNYVMEEMEARELNVYRVYGDCFVGGAIPGFSITILTDFKGCRTEWLDLPTECKIWQQVWASGAGSVATFQVDPGRLAPKATGQMVNPNLVPIIRRAVICACRALISCEQVLNTLHIFSRYGTDMKKGAEGVLTAVYRTLIDFRFPFNTLLTISELVQNNLPGTTGAMYACLFTGAAQPFLKNPVQRAGVISWLAALDSALRTLRAYTDSKEGVVSLALSIIPIIQTIFGPVTKLQDKELMEGENPLVLALERVKADLASRAVQGFQKSGRRAILANQMDVEQYALVIWLDAVFAATSDHYVRKRTPPSSGSSHSSRNSVEAPQIYV